ncbi:hypothetical protein HYH03_012791 [Edaphochlamys debaryana]|uniref:MYND-type domain-containing protein n=1 Tax=Edaphochlamys debaryana TaxID=47281 RepID=A0A835XTB3_9CHLO|nr:hypothetical protein HYH03_012791 [Edaphochlamys debaryana]|eukprot:KAG2488618.1 hypothetical protein HYH03_012791 [Edaphochlamys debaryana]
MSTPSEATDAMKLWTQACEEAGTVPWLTARMSAILPLVESLASAPQSSQDRNRTTARLFTTQAQVLSLLEHLVSPVRAARGAQAGHGPLLSGPLWQPPFLRAVADAALGCAAYGREPEALARVAWHCPDMARGLAEYASLACSLLHGCPAATPEGACSPPLPAASAQLARSLAESRLLPAVARCVLQCPGPDPHDPHGGERGDEAALTHIAHVHAAAVELSVALESVLRWLCAAGAADAAPQLASQLSHPDVVALQEALLERLCVHGGVELEGEGQALEGQAEELEGQEEAEWGWAGARGVRRTRGRVCSPPDLGWSTHTLEYAHAVTLNVLYYTLHVLPALPAAAGSTAFAARRARLTRLEPRALEALCRLHRGQGLGGAFEPTQTWSKLTLPTALGPLLEVTRSAESAAWALALHTEALQGELEGRRCSEAPTQGQHHGMFRALLALLRVGGHRTMSAEPLNYYGRMALAEVFVRTGLDTSLDHALRLSFAAADRAALAPDDPQLQRLAAATVATTVSVLLVLDCLGFPLVARYGLGGGVLVTLGKRARMVTRRLQELEAEAEPKGRGKDERQRAARAREAERLLLSTVIRCLLQPMPSCLLLADAALFRVYGENCTVYGTGALPYKADQALFVERAACALVTHVMARAALRRVGGETSVYLYEAAALLAVSHLREAARSTAALGAPRLLLLQPHRLLAAACKLLCPGVAAPMGREPFCDEGDDVSSDLPRRLRFDIAAAVFALAADSGLSSRAQAWLLPPEGAVCGAAEGAAAAAGEAERGCLEPLLRYRLLPQLRAEAPGVASALLLLLAAACTSGNGSDGGGTDSTDGAAAQSTGGEFCALASTLFTSVPGRMSPGQWGRTDAATKQEKLLLDQCGGLASGQGFVLLAHYVALKASVEAGGSGMWPRQAELLAAPLPPPIAVPLAEAALPGLRVCAYPGCLSYGGRSEAKLRLQKCGRCKCVRYCGPDCAAAHWREGHEGECHSH